MMNGCNSINNKLIIENKISNQIQENKNVVIKNNNFLKNSIIKKEKILNENQNVTKQKDNDVIFEFRTEKLLQGRENLNSLKNNKSKKALSAVFNMLEKNITSDNNNFNLYNKDKIINKSYFKFSNESIIYKNILAFIPLSGPYSKYGNQIRKALDLSVLYFSDKNIKIIYYDTGKNLNKKEIKFFFDKLKPFLVIGPFTREVLLKIKPVAKSRSIPIFTFSNDIALIENNVWSFGFSPEEQVEKVISCALRHGYKNFGLIAPDNLYGQIIINASIELINENKINKHDKLLISNSQLNKKTKLFSILKRFLNYTEDQISHTKFDSIFISGSKEFILEIAPLLSFFNVDSRKIKILGTEKFNAKEIKNEPSLENSWFPLILSKNNNEFKLIWREIWGDKLNYFSNVGFDSGIIGISYVNDEKNKTKYLKKAKGPVSGLTFKSNGYVEKPIHIMEIKNLGKLANVKKCNAFTN